jgi:TonB-linked SusC/RagA family outer membrane protein
LTFSKVSENTYTIAPILKMSILPSAKIESKTAQITLFQEVGTIEMRKPLLFAGQRAFKITGKITDEGGAPLIGASILLKGTTTGTISDVEGKYAISVPDENAQNGILIFSYIGYTLAERAINSQSVIDVRLDTDVKALQDVVVVGYGTQDTREVTGSIASINTSKIKDIPVTNVVDGMAGKLPGVLIQQTTGAPGTSSSIKIRGLGSISAGNGPLIVVDGQPLNSGDLNNPGGLNLLNPNDIEKIDVLKDASATAIYGSRGANGVVMVTTKRGKSGKAQINFDYYTATQEISKKMDLLNSQQYAELGKEAYNNAYLQRVPNANINDPNSVRAAGNRFRYPRGLEFPGINYDSPESLPTYDYQSLIFEKAPINNYQISGSGGSEKVQFMVSANYLQQKGIIQKSSIDRFTFRSNVDAQLSPKLKVGMSISPSFTTQGVANSDGHWANNGIITAALTSIPFIPVYQADGVTYNSQASIAAPYDYPGITNPIANMTEIDDKVRQLRLLGNMYAELDIWKNLKYRGTIGGDFNYVRRNYFQPSTLPLNQLLPPTINSGYSFTNQNINWITNHVLSYKLELDNAHSISGLVGIEAQKNDYQENRINANNFPNNDVRTLNAGTITSANSFQEQWALASYFARVTYAYKDKYLFNASVRQDGSSRFGKENRFGTFPSVSVGWRVSEEEFLKNVDFLSELKLRASYGFSGNNAFGNYTYIGLLGRDNYALGNSLVNGVAATTISNSKLGWERSQQMDIGLELGLFGSRIFISADYYRRLTTDLLLAVQVPTLTGFATAAQNIGQMENKGFELAVNTRNVVGQFTWTTDLNFSINRNKVLTLGPTGDPIRNGTGIGETNITQIGLPIGNLFGYKQIGVFKNLEDLNSYPRFADTQPGDVKYEDVNGDGKIDANDRTTLGNNQPDFIYGMTNNFSYKGFDLSIAIQGVQGGKILNLSRRFINSLEGNANQLTVALSRWRSPNDLGDGITPRANSRTTGNNNAVSSRWVEDASYFRIRNITLGYNVPSKLVQKAKIQSFRIYGGVQNALTISKYLGYNPEVSGYESPLTGGVDYGTYPLARTYTLGVNIGF